MTANQQKILSYQYLPISEITLHTAEELQSLKNKEIISDLHLSYNQKDQRKEMQKGNKKEGFRKWAKDIDKISKMQKLTQLEKIQLFNKNISSESQMVLVLPKLQNISAEARKQLLKLL